MLYMLRELEKKLEYSFNHNDLLKRALTHPSYAAEKNCDRDNQRLEFLGDAVLQLAVTSRLFIEHPDADEGFLSRLRAAMTRKEALVEMANDLELGKYIMLGRGERKTGGGNRGSILADCMEAIIGAVFLDSDYPTALDVVEKLTANMLARGESLLVESNPKGALQEYTQTNFHGERPCYTVVGQDGPEHEPQFTVTVSVAGTTYGQATAGNRRSAECEAARAALEYLKKNEIDEPEQTGKQK